MRLVAKSQLTGSYGTVANGQEFECPDATALELLRAGCARKAGVLGTHETKAQYETKVIVPEASEVGPRSSSFRELPVPDSQPPDVAPESHRVLPKSDAPKRGAAHLGGRRGRTRSRSG
jgi:hypothetical protein